MRLPDEFLNLDPSEFDELDIDYDELRKKFTSPEGRVNIDVDVLKAIVIMKANERTVYQMMHKLGIAFDDIDEYIENNEEVFIYSRQNEIKETYKTWMIKASRYKTLWMMDFNRMQMTDEQVIILDNLNFQLLNYIKQALGHIASGDRIWFDSNKFKLKTLHDDGNI